MTKLLKSISVIHLKLMLTLRSLNNLFVTFNAKRQDDDDNSDFGHIRPESFLLKWKARAMKHLIHHLSYGCMRHVALHLLIQIKKDINCIVSFTTNSLLKIFKPLALELRQSHTPSTSIIHPSSSWVG